MKRRWLPLTLLILAAIGSVFCAKPAMAIDLPDSSPSIEAIDAYQNVLETGDFLIIIYEKTPYASPPTTNYSDAFVWRLFDTTGTEELAQSLSYDYNDYGYGYNVISFYFDSDDVTSLMGAGYWEQPYIIRLSGTPIGFEDDPPNYNFSMTESDYSALEETDEVKAEISQRVVEIATDLDNKWGLTTTYSLIYSSETGTTLSIYGETFFRGAIYGLQAMAPAAFQIEISNIDLEDRTWTITYESSLEAQYAGTYLEGAMNAGEDFFEVDYNLMGLLIVIFACMLLIFANLYLAGGNNWRGLIEATPFLVIGGRLALIGLGELGLVTAVAWLYISAKIWKLI